MDSPKDRLSLSSRPRWFIVKMLKWATIISMIVAFILFLSAIWLSFEVDTFNEASESGVSINFDYDYWAAEFVYIAFSIGLLWLFAIIADRIDQLVWLNASREDQDELLSKRKRS